MVWFLVVITAASCQLTFEPTLAQLEKWHQQSPYKVKSIKQTHQYRDCEKDLGKKCQGYELMD
jgi:hypothetical protein